MTDQITLDGSTRQQKLYDYSIEILRIAEPPEGYYLATSFGKDSIAAQRICDEAGVKYDAHHNITGIDPPELVAFGKKHYPDVERHMYPKISLDGRMVPGSMWRLIQKKSSLPMMNRRFCCEYLKEGGGRGRRVVMGLRAAESTNRKINTAPVKIHGKNKQDVENKRMFEPDDIAGTLFNCAIKHKVAVNPMFFWEDSDLWDFIRDRELPYCSLYDEGFKRLGCIGCPNGSEKGRRRDFNRWLKFYDMYLRAIERLRAHGKYMNFTSAEAVMEWWVSDTTQSKTMDGQMELEEMEGAV